MFGKPPPPPPYLGPPLLNSKSFEFLKSLETTSIICPEVNHSSLAEVFFSMSD
jgi:hypothetical protein